MLRSSVAFPETIARSTRSRPDGAHRMMTIHNESAELNAYRLHVFACGDIFGHVLHVVLVASSSPRGRSTSVPVIVASRAVGGAFIDDREQNSRPHGGRDAHDSDHDAHNCAGISRACRGHLKRSRNATANGLGRIGGNMVRRLLQGGTRSWSTTAVPSDPGARASWAEGRARPHRRLQASSRPTRRLGDGAVRTAVESTIEQPRAPSHPRGHRDRWRQPELRDSDATAAGARAKIEFVDAGTSGGIWGSTSATAWNDRRVQTPSATASRSSRAGPRRLRAPRACRCRHYVKMVHNGIEYGMLQAYAEATNPACSKDFS